MVRFLTAVETHLIGKPIVLLVSTDDKNLVYIPRTKIVKKLEKKNKFFGKFLDSKFFSVFTDHF